MIFFFQASIALQHEVEIVCLSSLDMLIQTVLLIMDRSAPILVSIIMDFDARHHVRNSNKLFSLRIFRVAWWRTL
jgi:hypothetical protein